MCSFIPTMNIELTIYISQQYIKEYSYMNEHQTLSDIEKKGSTFYFTEACYSCSLWKNKCLFTHHTYILK